MPAETSLIPSGRLQQRVASLAAHFERVHTQRMLGIPVLNPLLEVEAVGFRWGETPESWDDAVAEGVLITPWFMSLVRLPARVLPHGNRVGRKFVRDFGCERFDFIAGHDEAVGYHETCALFSPMQGFASQQSAVDTALEALELTRAQVVEEAAPKPLAVPTRRAFFLMGRAATGGEGVR